MSLKKNVIANYLGHGWVALMGIAFIPAYIKYLGIEAYGLIGIFLLLQGWLSLLDAGISPTLSKEMARFSGGAYNVNEIRDLLRSVEIIIGVLAAGVFVCILTSAKWLTLYWIKAKGIPIETLTHSITLMGLIIGLRLLENIYRSGIIGLQQHVLLNVINSLIATLKGIGAIFVLIYVSPTIEAFFWWQTIVSILSIIIFAYYLHKTLPKTNHISKFSYCALKKIIKFSSGLFLVTSLSIIITQSDKIFLSKILTLQEFGAYSLVLIISGALYTVINPIVVVFFPSFTKATSSSDTNKINLMYHYGSQIVAIIGSGFAAVIFFFAKPILQLWLQDIELAEHLATLLQLLVIASFFQVLTWIPHQAQLAHNWIGFSIKFNIVAVLFIVPSMFLATTNFGAQGAAYVMIFLYLTYIIIGIQFMHQKILINEKSKWYLNDTIYPSLISITISYIFSHLIELEKLSSLYQITCLLLILMSIIGCNLLLTPNLRKSIFRKDFFNTNRAAK